MKYFARLSHDPWRSGLNAWLRSSVCVLYSVASTLQDFIASNSANNSLRFFDLRKDGMIEPRGKVLIICT